MKYDIIYKHPSALQLDLIMAGWAADGNIFKTLPPTTADLIVCYDYRDLTLDLSKWKKYQQVRLCAWSMGVWAAEHTEAINQLPIVERTAINGTPWPIDNERGIPENIFLGTLGGFSDRNLVKFRHRMCGKEYREFMNNLPQRPVEEIRDELKHLSIIVPQTNDNTLFHWDKAFVTDGDLIIPVENQHCAWTQRTTPIITAVGAHYCAKLFEQWRNNA